MKNIKNLLSLSLSAIILTAACTPTQTTRGNMVEDFRISEITEGISTQTNVLKSLGSPTTKAPFDDKVWYYIGQKMEKKGIFDPQVTEEQVVRVSFNDKGIVETIQRVDADRIEVPRVRRKTPTSGNDITVLEQVLGNVGRFNKNAGNATDTAGVNR